jgi:hypothetical protein
LDIQNEQQTLLETLRGCHWAARFKQFQKTCLSSGRASCNVMFGKLGDLCKAIAEDTKNNVELL